MKTQSYKKRIAWILWFTYLCVNIPFVVLHHHHFSKADEQYEFQSNDDLDAQLASFQERCFLCDHHFIPQYKPVFFDFNLRVVETISKPPFSQHHFHGCETLLLSLNKDPPMQV